MLHRCLLSSFISAPSTGFAGCFFFFKSVYLHLFKFRITEASAFFRVFFGSFVGLCRERNLIFNTSEKNNTVIKTKIF